MTTKKPTTAAEPPVPVATPEQVDAWYAAGLLNPDQVDAARATLADAEAAA